jgi:hypothetical protein
LNIDLSKCRLLTQPAAIFNKPIKVFAKLHPALTGFKIPGDKTRRAIDVYKITIPGSVTGWLHRVTLTKLCRLAVRLPRDRKKRVLTIKIRYDIKLYSLES